MGSDVDERGKGGNLTAWLEYYGEGLQQTLERVWERMEQILHLA